LIAMTVVSSMRPHYSSMDRTGRLEIHPIQGEINCGITPHKGNS
jgi:hypothetical protein